MLERVQSLRPPLEFTLISGGRSNLTFTVIDRAGRRWVLRRPPLGHVLATAHDVAREHRVLTALASTSVPVPAVVGLCTDESVTGAPFYVMEHVDGLVVRDAGVAARLGPAQKRTAAESLVDVLAAIHRVDVDEVGLGDLGRREGYIGRQLARWHRQVVTGRTRPTPLIDRVHALLSAQIPEQPVATLVHGDYKLENCIVDPAGRVIAVLDWELCTLGDPLADLGLLMVYWSQPGEAIDERSRTAAAAAGGFPGRAELLDRYARATGRDLSRIDYYIAFGYWKLAAILEGVYTRYAAGVMAEDDPALTRSLAEGAEAYAVRALEAIQRRQGGL